MRLETALSILQAIIFIGGICAFLYLSWWCLFISKEDAGKLFLWWCIGSFTDSIFMACTILVIEDHK